ncbi:MAG: hypothetical protein EU539_06960 [Promethearchaeota archaeon]|nr:MAG: hypothetical protein EU539_06960 [Candidatus Lokiarchaeota archaeon]
MNYAIMFNVLEGGVSQPIKWDKANLTPERSIIVLDESNQVVWLFHGAKQGLVARRTALRQAESLKGHGYTVGKSIIGRDLKKIIEIDERKIGRDPETDKLNAQFQEVLNKEYSELDNNVITFGTAEAGALKPKPAVIKEQPPAPKSEPIPEIKPQVKPAAVSPPPTKPVEAIASEYDEKSKPAPSTKPTSEVKSTQKEGTESQIEEARIAFVLKSVLDFYDDIWVSRKKDGSYTVEIMDGPICQFSVKEGVIKFSPNSFSGLSTNITNSIKKKYVELSKLL